MEAIGAAASVIAIVEIVGRVSASAASFMRDIKDARKDMIEVRKDMADLSTVLRMIAEDLDHPGQGSSSSASSRPDDAAHSQQHVVDIAHSCGAALLEIETVLRDGRSRLAWVTSGKKRVDGLRARLETCKLSLDVALDYRTMVVVHDIKVDSTRIVGDVSSIQRDVALLLNKVDNIERTAWVGQESPDDMAFPGGVMLDRFLNDCRSDAQTVLDNIDYQEDQDFEDVRQQVRAETPKSNLESRPEVTPPSPSTTILFRNSLGHEHQIPWEQCSTWVHMEEIIRNSYPPDSPDAGEIKNGRYTLYHDGQAVPPAKWLDFVNTGSSVDLKLWNDETIRFKDAVGRKFNFPFHSINTWKTAHAVKWPGEVTIHTQGIKKMVKRGFAPMPIMGYHVQQGLYWLTGPDGEIMTPVTWEQVIRPHMKISMRMWHPDDPWPKSFYKRIAQSLAAGGSPSQPTGTLDSKSRARRNIQVQAQDSTVTAGTTGRAETSNGEGHRLGIPHRLKPL